MPQLDEPGAIDQLINSRPFRALARENYSDSDWRIHRYIYHRFTETVDAQIGLLLDALKESEQEENTVIIFTSDHGDMSASHKLEHKTVFYNEASRIPPLIYQKGATQKGVVDKTSLLSNGIDIIPTIYDYAGIYASYDLEGKSIRPIAEGKNVADKRSVIKLESEIGRMIITENYKYARFYFGRNHEQLYDLSKDPFEMKNSIDLSENETILVYHRNLFEAIFN